MTKRGYKVVSTHRITGHLFPAIEDLEVVEYGIGKKTVPNENAGPLGVFDTLDHARFFAGGRPMGSYLRIFECEYEPSKTRGFYRSYGWYETNRDEMGNPKPIALPPGADFADEVTLIAEVT
jgi:hypothetical protein